ncbi:BgTH12-03436 [Blumeria graminis f. sp. triticale]|uniref:Bgt-4419 n=3 Tax=Blumeria graminis TaxID=34373 RepID=A0A9X9L7Z4_BLUGR|nr:Nuclear actin-related protein [Blumeria graminis f. sp. tritici 96224]CAD6499316.1 BgTH12-03436 [Blumeria graminis f. sp. triticale]VCU39435.1 Bgt-4419 [Blumeria graminis f. sp. tritici]
MAGKKSGKALLREEGSIGLQRTDNGMKQSSWPEIQMINQKNYYTEYMKRDDQILPHRLQHEANRDRMIRNAKDKDRALARSSHTEVPVTVLAEGEIYDDETGINDGFDASKIIVIHPGSQNLRIGLASDALPKSVPMTLAAKWQYTESSVGEPRPKRQKIDDIPEQQFGEEFSKKFAAASAALKIEMRANKYKVLPNSKEVIVNYNRRTEFEKVSEHNDPLRIEWTDISKVGTNGQAPLFVGMKALRIPDDSNPPYKLFWPIQHGCFHEQDYVTRKHLFDDFDSIISSAVRNELCLQSSIEWKQYSCVFVIPDLYDKRYVEQVLDMCLRSFEFKQVCFIQESLAASYGSGFTSTCIVDIGAQKTSICCVEDGMCIEDSRINLKYGGFDVTETFIKMMLHDYFPYADINLRRRYDFLLAEELKINICTMNAQEVSQQLFNFHLRTPNESTRKYYFKAYDEVILAPMGFFDPSLFDNSEKLVARRKLIDRSYNAYDSEMPDDPTSAAQLAILAWINPSISTNANSTTTQVSGINGYGSYDASTLSKDRANILNPLSRFDETGATSHVTSTAVSPAPEGANTPIPTFIFGATNTNGEVLAPSGNPLGLGTVSHQSGTPVAHSSVPTDQYTCTSKDLALELDSVLPIAPLDMAIITSITHGARGDEKKARDYFGGIMVIGGGAKTPNFGQFLEARLRAARPDLGDKLLVGTSPREMDSQVVVWKGASVYARMKTHESWIGQLEYERLGSRVLHHKVLWNY